MELKYLLILILFTVIYVTVGGVIFHALEAPKEAELRMDGAIFEKGFVGE